MMTAHVMPGNWGPQAAGAPAAPETSMNTQHSRAHRPILAGLFAGFVAAGVVNALEGQRHAGLEGSHGEAPVGWQIAQQGNQALVEIRRQQLQQALALPRVRPE